MATATAQVDVPTDVPLKNHQQRTLIGTTVMRTDFMDKIGPMARTVEDCALVTLGATLDTL